MTNPPEDRYRLAPDRLSLYCLVPCKLCGAPAQLWQRWLHDDVWHTFGACSNVDDMDGEPCLFNLPESEFFYHERKTDAEQYWNRMMGPRPLKAIV
jgi:hypothetical protein